MDTPWNNSNAVDAARRLLPSLIKLQSVNQVTTMAFTMITSGHGIPASPWHPMNSGLWNSTFHWSFHGDFDAWVSATLCRVWKGTLESQWLLWKTMDSLRGCTQCRWGTVADRVWNQRDCTKSKIRPGHSQSYDTGMVCSKAIQNVETNNFCSRLWGSWLWFGGITVN